jgi:hypothetical protein
MEFTEVAGLQKVPPSGSPASRSGASRVEPAQPGGKVRVSLKIAKQFADRVRKDRGADPDAGGSGDCIVDHR